MDNRSMVTRFLDVIEGDILPLTEGAVPRGHNIFGAAVLRARDLSLVVAATNERGADPTLHGEMAAIRAFFRDKGRPDPADTVFLATHEPCSMCLSALAWSGFRKIYFLFTYEETRDDFRMGDDLRILAEVFSTTVPSRKNSYFELVPLRGMIASLTEPEPLLERVAGLKGTYKALSEKVLTA